MGRWQADFFGDMGRIVMLLVSLAALAERAAWASVPRRHEMLGILLPAEVFAWAFLVEMATGTMVFGAPADDFALARDNPGEARDAVHLAVRLRILALCLILLSAAVRIARPKFLGGNPWLRIPTGQRAAPAAPDTS